jgi:hypothetical protein
VIKVASKSELENLVVKKKVMRGIPSVRLDSIRPKNPPVASQNYPLVKKIMNKQITNVANVIPRVMPMFIAIVEKKNVANDTTIKYKKNAFFEMR